MAHSHIRHIREIQPTGPYRLIGWSFGGLVAHEIAVQLQRAGEKVDFLACLDIFPDAGRREAPDSVGEEDRAEHDFLAVLMAAAGCEQPQLPDFVLDGSQVAALLARRYGLLPDVFDQWISNALMAMKRYQKMIPEFVPGRYAGELLLVMAAAGLDEISLINRWRSWRPHVEGEIERYPVDCVHADMMQERAQAEIGRIVTAALARLESENQRLR
jgi:thioesterase domain-containing protein